MSPGSSSIGSLGVRQMWIYYHVRPSTISKIPPQHSQRYLMLSIIILQMSHKEHLGVFFNALAVRKRSSRTVSDELFLSIAQLPVVVIDIFCFIPVVYSQSSNRERNYGRRSRQTFAKQIPRTNSRESKSTGRSISRVKVRSKLNRPVMLKPWC